LAVGPPDRLGGGPTTSGGGTGSGLTRIGELMMRQFEAAKAVVFAATAITKVAATAADIFQDVALQDIAISLSDRNGPIALTDNSPKISGCLDDKLAMRNVTSP
jgi:hypothetical protein